MSRKIGNGENTSFWSDPWLDGVVLRSRFWCMFELSVDPNVFVADMRRSGWKVDEVGWRWKSRLYT